MKRIISTFIFTFLLIQAIFSQTPEKFNYQGVLRNSASELVKNTNITVKLSLLESISTGEVIYSENHSVITNNFGQFSVQVGEGNVLSGVFSQIDWSIPMYLKTDVANPAGGSYTEMGVVQLLSVPYSLYSNKAKILDNKALYFTDTDTLFAVKDHDGNIVFVVFPDGAKVYVNDQAKGSVGGFAVSGRSPTKSTEYNVFNVTPDSTHFYINENITGKGSVGGFAVSGRSPTKAGVSSDYFNISGSSTAEIIDPSEARILWYPKKEAFLSGRVLIESPDSVGFNSLATGYQSKSIGNYSQAMGYNSISRGNFSTAIGNYAYANGNNSFALGDNATANSDYAFALGSNAIVLSNSGFAIGNDALVTGISSYAIGSTGRDTLGNSIGMPTRATGDYAFAIGLGAIADTIGAISLGTNTQALGAFSLATGSNTIANGRFATSMGFASHSSGQASIAIGFSSIASGWAAASIGIRNNSTSDASLAVGYENTASGWYSVAMGSGNLASNSGAFALGIGNNATGNASIVAGGYSSASGNFSIALGYNAKVNAATAVAIGNNVTANSEYSYVLGNNSETNSTNSFAIGNYAVASEYKSFAIGNNVTASNSSIVIGNKASSIGTWGSFVYGDASSSEIVNAIGNNSFTVRASGGTTFYSNSALTVGVSLIAGSGAWASVSDKNKKENFKDVDKGDILNKFSKINIQSWNYKSQSQDIKHIGITAQDFYENFGFGESDTTLTWIDVVGINSVIIQELNNQLTKVQQENFELKMQIAEINKRLGLLEK